MDRDLELRGQDGRELERDRGCSLEYISADVQRVWELWCTYLEEVSSLTTRGRAERSDRAERAPKVDVGQQRTRGQQQGGSLRESRRIPIHLIMDAILYGQDQTFTR